MERDSYIRARIPPLPLILAPLVESSPSQAASADDRRPPASPPCDRCILGLVPGPAPPPTYAPTPGPQRNVLLVVLLVVVVVVDDHARLDTALHDSFSLFVLRLLLGHLPTNDGGAEAALGTPFIHHRRGRPSKLAACPPDHPLGPGTFLHGGGPSRPASPDLAPKQNARQPALFAPRPRNPACAQGWSGSALPS
ncbi:uncharacterized protein PSFLO_05761 [Pseudozyma flocculosa]|uniref:Uncharacterized protein n=1 Tax=Pseudozyma flocculosa TaxID=84751 RepID=A0A5C3FAG0_9BASI|nr:uncharacterized protein PSFLO_05761 [Pseudozyma flocculosa]